MGMQGSFAADAVSAFLNDFGETIVYTPAGGSPTPIQAVVNREPASAVHGFDGSAVYAHEISIANDPSVGVTSVSMGRDSVPFAGRVGGTPELFSVLVVLANDE